MARDKAERESGKSFSSLVVIAGCAVSLLIGLVGGVLTGPSIKAALGVEQNNLSVVEAELTTQPAVAEDPSSLFAPMPGVFSPDKERFYADAGEFLVAIKYQGRTRYLQLTAQLVGHDEDFMGKVETDVPAIRNGLSIFFTQQDFSQVSTLEGRESLRLATLVEINKIIGATPEMRVADVYFTDYITQ